MQAATDASLKQFEIENDIINEDIIFQYDEEENQKILESRPWDKTPDYFKRVKMSAIALLKIVTHTTSSDTEVMGLLKGKVYGDAIIIIDTFLVPDIGTCSCCHKHTLEYVPKYNELEQLVGRPEGIVGWYHSHPSYGCYLGGIDISTQQMYQKTGPMVAVVIDPVKTMAAGKVDIQAFRTYPEGFLSQSEDELYFRKYYALEISYYKSSLGAEVLDMLWNQYWIQTLTNRNFLEKQNEACDKICSLSRKVTGILDKKAKKTEEAGVSTEASEIKEKEKSEDKSISLDQLMRKDKSEFQDLVKFSSERSKSLMEEIVKKFLF